MKTLDVNADSNMIGIIRGVEELDGVRSALTAEPVRLDGDLNAESLQIYHSREDDERRDEVHNIR
jgi:hypothetical protein